MTTEHLDNGSIRRLDDPGEPQTGTPRISISTDEKDILTHMATNKHVLEIGTGLGISTRALATNAKCVWTYDIDEWVRNEIWPHLPTNAIGITNLNDMEYHPDLVFIDADHSTPAVTADIAKAESLCQPGAIIVLHDTKYPNVRAACNGPEWSHIDTTHGLSWKTV